MLYISNMNVAEKAAKRLPATTVHDTTTTNPVTGSPNAVQEAKSPQVGRVPLADRDLVHYPPLVGEADIAPIRALVHVHHQQVYQRNMSRQNI